jgi:uncharacterized protein
VTETAPGTRTVAATAVPGFTAEEQAVLDDIVRRIVAVAAPDRIILFGSAARGDAHPDSDLDLLIIKRGPCHRGRVTDTIYRALFGADRAVDAVVVTQEDIERYRDSFALIIYPALREGWVIYDAA